MSAVKPKSEVKLQQLDARKPLDAGEYYFIKEILEE